MTMTPHALKRFLDAQDEMYFKALAEVTNGKKVTHWMWFIFPQLKGLGFSETAKFYGITALDEAAAYLSNPVLGTNLVAISEVLLKINGKSATAIFGTSDDLKLRSCMTLFSKVPNADPVFSNVLDQYFMGITDARTIQILEKNVAK